MAVPVSVSHRTTYRYDRPIVVNAQTIRLRPAPHCRTPILSYSLKVTPQDHQLRWQPAPLGHHQARVFFPGKVKELLIDVELLADLAPRNPFDFFLEPHATTFPFQYDPALQVELQLFLDCGHPGPRLGEFVRSFDLQRQPTAAFLVQLNQSLQRCIRYQERLEPGIQDCEKTLALRTGSCRDSAWLLVCVARQLGLAARFVSGYLVQLEAGDGSDQSDGEDSVELHAWAEIYLPGAGWVGLDPTSGLLAGEGHIPLACAVRPENAAPVAGRIESSHAELDVSLTVQRTNANDYSARAMPPHLARRLHQLGNSRLG